jgi:hypothetical protein
MVEPVFFGFFLGFLAIAQLYVASGFCASAACYLLTCYLVPNAIIIDNNDRLKNKKLLSYL